MRRREVDSVARIRQGHGTKDDRDGRDPQRPHVHAATRCVGGNPSWASDREGAKLHKRPSKCSGGHQDILEDPQLRAVAHISDNAAPRV